MSLKYADFSSSDPYFAFDSVPYMNSTEGVWTISWIVSAGNCSSGGGGLNSIGDGIGGGMSASHVPYQAGPTQFTTKNGAQQPDLVAATADDTCANSGNVTFDVTAVLKVALPEDYNGRSSCAVLPTPLSTPPANPCGAKINSSAAASISAAITSCAVHQPTVSTGCIPLTTSDGFRAQPGGMAFLAATVWLLMCFS
jgi:hypothetical protein